MARNLTIHIIQQIPMSNLNRDESGNPKHIIQGGALRAMLSSQSIKRGIRTIYERESLDDTVRSGNFDQVIAAKVLEHDNSLNEKKVLKAAAKTIEKLTNNSSSTSSAADSDETASAGSGKASGKTSIWLSTEERDTAAARIAASFAKTSHGEVDAGTFLQEGATGSLAIAAFGRMFAKGAKYSTEAALSISPAVTTHPAQIQSDFFSVLEEAPTTDGQHAATTLSVLLFTSGVFYRSITIDREQLRSSWTEWNSPDADRRLGLLVDAILYGLPRGKSHATGPYVQPALVLVEEQKYRAAYGFETPVKAAREGGYLAPTISELARQYAAARRFDPDNFDGLSLVTGTAEHLEDQFSGARATTKRELIDAVVRWIRSE